MYGVCVLQVCAKVLCDFCVPQMSLQSLLFMQLAVPNAFALFFCFQKTIHASSRAASSVSGITAMT